MGLEILAALQKRIKDWQDFAHQGGIQDPNLYKITIQKIVQLKEIITRCWQLKQVSEQDQININDLERQLEQLNEEARMTVVGKKHGLPQQVI